MVRIERSQRGRAATGGVGILCAVVAAPALSAVIVVTAAATDAAPGAPRYWPWLLTGLQVLGLWSAGTGRQWGWLLGAAVQLPWIAYGVVTEQIGFIPGCAVSAAVQTNSFLSGRRRLGTRRGTARTKEGTPCMSSA